jgi:glycosyltransferase involved in cell wall biosynthesis
MIIIYHTHEKVISISYNNKKLPFEEANLTKLVFELSKLYPENWIIWCEQLLENSLNIEEFSNIFHHEKMLVTYSVSGKYIISDMIHYIDTTFFAKPNRNVRFVSYFMSSEVGAVHSSVLNNIEDSINKKDSFAYFLCSLAKLAIPLGLLCYSDTQLLKNTSKKIGIISPKLHLDYRFISEHWKKQWLIILFLNILIYEKRVTLLPFLKSLFYKRRKFNESIFDNISVKSSKQVVTSTEIDVIIPTIGRKKYLYDVLNDFSKQTILPKKVIIIEQNPLENSLSELDYLVNETFPFEIKHIFTHRTGACNARNVALAETSSEWIFLADDDIRVSEQFFNNVMSIIKHTTMNAFSVSCLQKNQKKEVHRTIQSDLFGSGCSFIRKEIANICRFDLNFEHGFGEDNDFGMQIRNLGEDVFYVGNIDILHLKAPIGGFRTKPELKWKDEVIPPKPSPTIMLFKIKHYSKKQILGYKTFLMLNFYKIQKIRNPIKYIRYFNQQWEVSIKWANKLINIIP